MNSKRTNVQNLDAEISTGNGAKSAGRVRRVIKRKLREMHIKGFGFTVRFRQQDEQGSEET